MDVAHPMQALGTTEDFLSSVVPSSLPLATACYIEDLNSVRYPSGIANPKTELNTYSQPGKFKYDRNFLLQFKAVCTEKPEKMRTICFISTIAGLQPCSLHDSQTACYAAVNRPKKKGTKTTHAREGSAKPNNASTRDAGSSGHPASSIPAPLAVLGSTRGEKNANRGGKTKKPAKIKPQDKKQKTVKTFITVNLDKEEAGPSAQPSQEHKGVEVPEARSLVTCEADALKKIDEDVKLFFSGRNLDEAEVYLSSLPPAYHQGLIDGLVSRAVETNEADATLVADFLDRAASKSLCSAAAFENGFQFIAEFVEDIAINTPDAWAFMATMVKGANFDAETQRRIASHTPDADKLLALL
ncbi:hypothetical protein EYR40_007068 [Pleurotus pulmonarius]|nr:hypothetical protein EYR36_003662 [Pleurotus pulmonarius]KAF4598716.1 hypothetical protein EYR38_007124 [Pleurotus pulmonarius]KAF4599962.1 hypothetical protein EYR40_007068 [Pleurotus pulmonarius]